MAVEFSQHIRHHILGLSTIVSILVYLWGCTKTVVYDEDKTVNLRKELKVMAEQEVAVDCLEQRGDIFVFSLSNGTKIRFDGTHVPIMTIDIQGCWQRNGVKTDISLDTKVEDSFSENGREVLGIVEGFVEWTFCLSGNESISLGKSLFSIDPDVIVRGVNHRGFSTDAPENTLPAYRLSKLKGFKYVETDVRFTADGIPVLIHDATIERTSNSKGVVDKMRFDEIRCLDFGEWKNQEFEGTKIPSLAEFLALCYDIDLCPYIELKAGSKQQIESVVSMVEDYGLKGRSVFISFSSELLEYVVGRDSTAMIGFLVGSPLKEDDIQTALGLLKGSNYVFIDSSDYSDSAVSLCRNASVPLEVWTINSKSTIESLSPFISGVTSNCYHAGRIMAEKGGNPH